jgi:predicted nucleic acid-binding protein
MKTTGYRKTWCVKSGTMIIIDTNVYSALYRGDTAAKKALEDQDRILVPIMVVGELQYGFIGGNRQAENELMLERFMAQVSVDIVYPTTQTASIYSQLALACRLSGRALSHNDLWIAALSMENSSTLVTYDRDFVALTDSMGDGLLILAD